jgi:cyanophycin synthetase
MKCEDSRRLTGPNLQSRNPGAIAEVSFEPGDAPDGLITFWRNAVQEIAEVLPFAMGPLSARLFDGGAALLCESDVDSLYSAVEANEWAVETANARFQSQESRPISDVLPAIEALYAEERDPKLIALMSEAKSRGVPVLWDDDELSLGYGRFSESWPRTALPSVHEVTWSKFKSIPVVLVTGTNGKTTTARLTASILHAAGMTVGNSSTDGISLNGRMIESGDWTGPGAARAILRHLEVDIAVLEAARGGILRRGLGVETCSAALVTNISDDHLGDYGILDCDGMAAAKGVVYGLVADAGYRVINVDDERVRRVGLRTASSGVIAFSVRGRSAVSAYLNEGHPCIFYEDMRICFEHKALVKDVIDVTEMPLARNGAALHNVSNAMGAIGLAWSVGASFASIRTALSQFGARWSDNPGRGQWTHVDGVHILMDFGHNPHGIDAVLRMAKGVLEPNQRMSVCIAQAGDRSDDDLVSLAETVAGFEPDRVVVRDLPEIYRRGRMAEDIAQILTQSLARSGVQRDSIVHATGEVAALESSLLWANPGDLVIHLVHVERDAINARLKGLGAPM